MTSSRSVMFGLFVVCLLSVGGCIAADDEIGGANTQKDLLTSLQDSRELNMSLPFSSENRHVVTSGPGNGTHTEANGIPGAIDLAGQAGVSVLAPIDGVVRLEPAASASCPAGEHMMPPRGSNDGYGNRVYIYSVDGHFRIHLAHMRELTVMDGQSVRRGDMIGREGQTGCASGPNIHMDCAYRSSERASWEPRLCEPLGGRWNLSSGDVVGGVEYVNLPVGTTVQAYDQPEIYLVCAPQTLCHINDWEAYVSRRYSSFESAPLVRVSEDALDCYARGETIDGLSERYVVTCGDGDYLVIRDGGRAIRRYIPWDVEAHEPDCENLLLSWGIIREDFRSWSMLDCILPRGETLTFRDGTVFRTLQANPLNSTPQLTYVVVGDEYENEASQPQHEHGYAVRIPDEADGWSFLDQLYVDAELVVLEVRHENVWWLVSRIVHGDEFGPDEARECQYGFGSGGPGESVCGDGVCSSDETCSNCSSDCGACATVCGDDSCNLGESCQNCPADCGICPPVCGNGVCDLGESLYECPGDCSEGPFCGDGTCAADENCRNCQLDCGICPSPDPDPDPEPFCGDGFCGASERCSTCAADCGTCPPYCGDGTCNSTEGCHSCSRDCGACPVIPDDDLDANTVGCVMDGDVVQVTIIGPVLDRLIGGSRLVGAPTGIYYGSDGLGLWSVPYGSSDRRDIIPWPGGDGSVSFTLPTAASGLNFAVHDSAGHVAWFDIETAASPQMWNVVGDCVIDGTLIYFESDGGEEAPFCGDGVCGGGENCSWCAADCGACPEPDPDPISDSAEHVIDCQQTGSSLVMTIYGPVTDLLIAPLAGVPVGIYAGCNNVGGWSIPYGDSDPRPWAPWLGDSEVYELVFPVNADGINLAVANAGGHVAWFDIETAMTADAWEVTGDCHISGTLIYQN